LGRGSVAADKLDQLAPQHGYGDARLYEECPEIVPRDQMRVQVKYHLAAATIDIDEESVPGFGDAQLYGKLLSHVAHVSNKLVPSRNVVERRDMRARNNQDVDR
jgi:hypothetical protein